MKHFYAYRIFLNQIPNKQVLIEFRSKKESFIDFFIRIQDQQTIKFNDYGEHVIIFEKKLGEDIYLLKLAKKQQFDKPTLEDGKIEDVKDVRYPNIYFLVHLNKQIILIEKNTTVFQTMDAVKDKLVKVLTEEMLQDRVYCNLSEITDHRDFWEQINDLDSVQKVELEYEPPNFFGGKNVADKLVKDVHEETNFDKFKIILRNKKEGLRFQYEDFKEHIQRISQGAGNYIIEGLKDGADFVFTKKTKSHIKIDVPDIEEETEESLETRFKEIEDINDDENI
ncbi:hypothetical protein [Flavobacterium sp. 1355]|uniref:hypothetical protein n=1 Tax=Flavobacterium sp. 1355 TaxID=2806571 RepID=UPI001AE33E92|nr:hypothetical protein [Flavobacterium sp. 1355]MBP1223150.1 putative NIF3 family GTP cyclohydrolase 1 type 2 [Flavobacterium sp. 1355]